VVEVAAKLIRGTAFACRAVKTQNRTSLLPPLSMHAGCEHPSVLLLVCLENTVTQQRAASNIFLGKNCSASPVELIHPYSVIDFYIITHVWQQKEVGKGGQLLTRFHFRAERMYKTESNWIVPDGEVYNPPNYESKQPLVEQECFFCHTTTPLIYEEGWFCGNAQCSQNFFKVCFQS
jgi:hypothetical protein